MVQKQCRINNEIIGATIPTRIGHCNNWPLQDFVLYYIIINFVIDRVAQKARPANVFPHKHTNTNTHTISNYIHTYIQLYKLRATLITHCGTH